MVFQKLGGEKLQRWTSGILSELRQLSKQRKRVSMYDSFLYQSKGSCTVDSRIEDMNAWNLLKRINTKITRNVYKKSGIVCIGQVLERWSKFGD
jgi:hypothetical protein